MGVVHRDLKPENVVMTEQHRPVIIDFETARDEEHSVTATMTGVVRGTAGYMAPEVMQGEVASCASDMYSFGVLLGEALFGRRLTSPEELDGVVMGGGASDEEGKLKEILQSLLSPQPGARLSASTLLVQPYFQGPARRFTCIVCYDDVVAAEVCMRVFCVYVYWRCFLTTLPVLFCFVSFCCVDRTRTPQGLFCSGGGNDEGGRQQDHFTCCGCVSGHVRALSEQDIRRMQMRGGSVPCPMAPRECQAPPFTHLQVKKSGSVSSCA